MNELPQQIIAPTSVSTPPAIESPPLAPARKLVPMLRTPTGPVPVKLLSEELKLAGPAELLLSLPLTNGEKRIIHLESITDDARLRVLYPREDVGIQFQRIAPAREDKLRKKIRVTNVADDAETSYLMRRGQVYNSIREFAQDVGCHHMSAHQALYKARSERPNEEGMHLAIIKGVTFVEEKEWQEWTLSNIRD